MYALEQAHVSAELRLHRLPKVFIEGFHCGASISVSESDVVIDCEGRLVVKTGTTTSSTLPAERHCPAVTVQIL